ncbi:DUF732 domain-containing protein [Actinoplanes sp. NPDC049596]|uniref:DUF732 domain-containing protein n=1 Tax=unclassified Actinoplanes TaxID=2626549 RepID=UPI0034236F2B
MVGARHVMVAGVLLALLAGCSDGDDKPGGAAASTGAGQQQATADATPKGDEAGFLKGLRALDADLAADERTAVDSGYNLCLDVTNGMNSAEVVKDASNLYSTDVSKAQKIVAIARTSLCR